MTFHHASSWKTQYNNLATDSWSKISPYESKYIKKKESQNYCTDGMHYEGKKIWSTHILADIIYSIFYTSSCKLKHHETR